MAHLIIRWMLTNKILILLAALSFCLFISTLALSVQNKNLKKLTQINIQDIHGLKSEQENRSISQSTKLSQYIKPTSYGLQLWPDITQKSFKGEVTIKLDILSATRLISLHSKDLNIHDVEVKNGYNKSIPVVSTNISTVAELLYVNLETDIEPNLHYELSIKFSGRLDKGIVGFYSSTMRNGA